MGHGFVSERGSKREGQSLRANIDSKLRGTVGINKMTMSTILKNILLLEPKFKGSSLVTLISLKRNILSKFLV